MSSPDVAFFDIAQIEAQRGAAAGAYLEFLRVAPMSAGLYSLSAGSLDRQSPHRQDELYYVLEGQARMRAGTHEQAVSRGSLIFVPAHMQHRFFDIQQDLKLLVFFAPAESE